MCVFVLVFFLVICCVHSAFVYVCMFCVQAKEIANKIRESRNESAKEFLQD